MIENIRNRKKSLTFHVCTGQLTIDDIKNEIKFLYENNPTDNHLWDFTGAALTGISTSEIANLAMFPAQLVPGRKGRKTAIVVGSNLGFGLGRMYEIHSGFEGPLADVMVFRSVEEAERWIDED